MESLEKENNITEGTETHRVRKIKYRNEKNYTQNLDNDKRNNDKKYVTANSKIIIPQKIAVKSCCLKNCGNKISPFNRQLIFDKFWKLASFGKQNLFLNTIVKREIPKKRRPRNNKSKPRQYQFKYYLTYNNESVLVCRKLFLDTFKISEGRLARALKKDIPGEDLRGKSKNSRRNTEESLVIAVKEHIQSFPTFTSHYISHNPYKKYLSASLNIRKMYNLYLEKCKNDKRQHVNEWIYRKIFKNDFNLHFHQPKKDICEKCDFFKLKIEACENECEKRRIKLEHDIHLRSAEMARKCLGKD